MSTDTKELLVTSNRLLAQRGVLEVFGHVSARAEDSDLFHVAKGVSPTFVTRDDLLTVNLDGEVVDGEAESTYKEVEIHRAIYARRDDVDAVVHHHAEEVMPFTVPGSELRPSVINNAVRFPDPIPVFEDYDPAFGRLVVTRDEGERMAENLAGGWAQFLEGHGANVAGRDVKDVVNNVIRINAEARIQLRTRSLHGRTIPAEPVNGIVDPERIPFGTERTWEYLTAGLRDRSDA